MNKVVSSISQALPHSSPTPLWGCPCLSPLRGLLEALLPAHPKSTISDDKFSHNCLGAIPVFLARLKACPEYKPFLSVPGKLHPRVSPRAEPFQDPVGSEWAFIAWQSGWDLAPLWEVEDLQALHQAEMCANGSSVYWRSAGFWVRQSWIQTLTLPLFVS